MQRTYEIDWDGTAWAVWVTNEAGEAWSVARFKNEWQAREFVARKRQETPPAAYPATMVLCSD